MFEQEVTGRYAGVSRRKAHGETYTPRILADFVAQRMIEAANHMFGKDKIRVLDPAVGSGELLVSLLNCLEKQTHTEVEVSGFETDPSTLDFAMVRLKKQFPNVHLQLHEENFLKFTLEHLGENGQQWLFAPTEFIRYDLIIANPPYVRTQILGANLAQALNKQFGLSGRFDLYHAFIIAMAHVLQPEGVAGIIVSNRFMTTKAGASLRWAIREQFNIRHVWDLGDTKLFDAAVLPAVLLLAGRSDTDNPSRTPRFTSIYETTEASQSNTKDPIEALSKEGVIQIQDGRRFLVRQGELNTRCPADGVWNISEASTDAWLRTVEANTWGRFRDIGKIRVGVKTCADKVFIRSNWYEMTEEERPELLRPLTTHHIARQFKALNPTRSYQILYPHEIVNGRRKAVDLSLYPRSRRYLENHRQVLEAREYVLEAGRNWYEIWVPQDPSAWTAMKLVFWDIADKPTFWIDGDGSLVNGDCYWLTCERPEQTEMLWLAVAVGNSTLIEKFYDHRFNNKLYAGRRRFITQYVEQFPLPNPESDSAKGIVAKAKEMYACIDSPKAETLAKELNYLVWMAFGLTVEEVSRQGNL